MHNIIKTSLKHDSLSDKHVVKRFIKNLLLYTMFKNSLIIHEDKKKVKYMFSECLYM